MDPNAPWKDSENATNAPSFRLWVHLGCNLGAGRVHLYQTRSQHFGVDTSEDPITVALDVFVVVADLSGKRINIAHDGFGTVEDVKYTNHIHMLLVD